jgi:uncharacterized protein YjbJ (UPF0337 family)
MSDEIKTKKNKLEQFSKSATAAKLSGTYHVTAGKIKRKLGEFTDDPELKKAGRNEEILGKIHRLVGSFRSVKEDTITKIKITKKEAQQVCIKHGGRMLDVASDFIEDMKNILLK